MIEPETARQVIAKAATLSKRMLIWDFLGNMRGEIDGSAAVVFKFGSRQNPIFAHRFASYLKDAGWRAENITMMNPETPHDIGWGLIDAVPSA